MASYTLVAIPSNDDPVWRFSSEEVPHLTLLFLGERLQDVKRVEEFIAHAVKTTLREFYLDVHRRGVLGDQKADVLFFDTKIDEIEMLKNFRAQLLTNTAIRNAYDSTEQFPSWIPHLTMGYPATPAKPDNRDYPGTRSVFFDRLALWTGDYEGGEFPLKKGLSEELRMSAKGETFLEHYGVKGMKWGVIRSRLSSGAKDVHNYVKTSGDAKAAGAVKQKAKIAGVDSLSNKDLATVITRMNLENQYKNLKQAEHDQSLVGMGKKWAGNFINDVLKDAAASWLKRPGSNFSGRTSARAYSWGKQVGGAIEGSIVQPRAIER